MFMNRGDGRRLRGAGAGPAVSGLLQETFELLLELADAAAAVHDLLVAARPGGVGLRIDIEVQLLAWLAIAGIGLELRTVRHHNGDLVIIGMNILFHRLVLSHAGVRLVFLGLVLLYRTKRYDDKINRHRAQRIRHFLLRKRGGAIESVASDRSRNRRTPSQSSSLQHSSKDPAIRQERG